MVKSQEKSICLLVAYAQDHLVASSLMQSLWDSTYELISFSRPALPLATATPKERREVTSAIMGAKVILGLIADGEGVDEWYEWTLSRAFKLGKCVRGLKVPGSRASTPLLYKYLGIHIVNYRPDLSLAEILNEPSTKV